MNRRKTSNARDENDEVEELLRAAEDAVKLKLELNSHSVHPSSSDLNPELDQRLRNLRTGSKSKAKPESSTKKTAPVASTRVKEKVEDDDLFGRFAALKASIPKPSTSTPSSTENMSADTLAGQDIAEDDEEDEVEKVIRWAMDAARLDPSPASDDDDDDDEYTRDNDSDDGEKSDEDTEIDDSPKGSRKGQRKQRKGDAIGMERGNRISRGHGRGAAEQNVRAYRGLVDHFPWLHLDMAEHFAQLNA